MNPGPLHIMLADDDEDDRMLFKEAFSELKIQTIVHTTNNGVELMAYLKTKSVPQPQFIFLDLNMPRKNGLACLQEIRANAKLKDIFIAIYSTSYNEKDMEETFINGANVYIVKPNNFNKLKQILDKAVKTAHLYQDKPMKKDNFILKIDDTN